MTRAELELLADLKRTRTSSKYWVLRYQGGLDLQGVRNASELLDHALMRWLADNGRDFDAARKRLGDLEATLETWRAEWVCSCCIDCASRPCEQSRRTGECAAYCDCHGDHPDRDDYDDQEAS